MTCQLAETGSEKSTRIPLYIETASVLLRLASPFFNQIDFSEASLDNCFEALMRWRVLRDLSSLLLERRAMQLSLAEVYRLREVLQFCPPGADVAFLYQQTWEERG
jgi:hypothetical protein